jgi:DNA-directed RNA polymerase specialized sigma24 family protein
VSTGSTGQTPSLAGFERLFAFLDADAERAAAKYEQVRLRLLKLFGWRGATPASEFVDRTVERVIRRLSDGGERSVAEPYQYFYGVAMNVLRESGLGHADAEPIDAGAPAADPNTPAAAAPRPADNPELVADAKRRSPALRSAIDALVPEYRYLLLDYHRSRSETWREELAASRGVPLTALRLRVHRLRSAVEKSVVKQMNQRAEDARAAAPASSSAHLEEAAQ